MLRTFGTFREREKTSLVPAPSGSAFGTFLGPRQLRAHGTRPSYSIPTGDGRYRQPDRQLGCQMDRTYDDRRKKSRGTPRLRLPTRHSACTPLSPLTTSAGGGSAHSLHSCTSPVHRRRLAPTTRQPHIRAPLEPQLCFVSVIAISELSATVSHIWRWSGQSLAWQSLSQYASPQRHSAVHCRPQ